MKIKTEYKLIVVVNVTYKSLSTKGTKKRFYVIIPLLY